MTDRSAPRRRRLKWVGRVIGMGFIGLNVLAYTHARAMLHFTEGGARTEQPEELSIGGKIGVLLSGVNIPKPQSERVVTDLDTAAQVVTIEGDGGVVLESWVCDRGADSPLVILFHGYAGEKSGLLEEAQVFLGLGCSMMLVDFRGSGGSSKSYTTIGINEAKDVATVHRYAKEHMGNRRVVLYGQSMGAVSIMRAVHAEEVYPDGVILEAVFDRMISTVRNRFDTMGVPSFPSAELL